MKFTKKSYGTRKEILKYKDYDAISVMVSDEGITASAGGQKIVKAGTIVAGKTKSVLKNDEVVVEKNTGDAEGVLLSDVDVTHGNAPGAMVTRGYINLDNIKTAPTAEAETALKSRILFIK